MVYILYLVSENPSTNPNVKTIDGQYHRKETRNCITNHYISYTDKVLYSIFSQTWSQIRLD